MKKLTKRQLRLKKKFEQSWNDYLKAIDGVLGEGKMLRGRDNK
ncbi:hypothetical protein [Spiroplasma endosymbiont of Stenodema calcarata]